MVKRFKILLLLLGAAVLCLGFAACTALSVTDEYEAQGYTVSVSYDPNGGSFMGRDGITIVDMFNPSLYTKDGEGNVSIKLTEPTSPDRPSGSSENIVLTRSGYFLAGWYQTRNLVTDAAGNAVDENGAVLEQTEDGSYVIAGTETTAYPAYTYAGLWDFENDRLVYNEADGKYALTLYACWIPYFEFDYYYEADGEWVLYGSTDFDYKTTNAEGSTSADRDTIWIPRWDDGAMNYAHSYADNNEYNFPSLENHTFEAAYADPERSQQITEDLEHTGYIDYESGKAVGRVQNVYVDFLEGTRYRIENAEQLSSHGDASGWYEIMADLDFKNGEVAWPAILSTNEFTGKFYSTEGQTYTIRNVSIKHSNASALQGGLFGSIAAEAVMDRVTFENATFDLAYTGTRLRDTNFGLFAGYIAEGAQITSVTVSGGVMKIGAITLGNGYSLNLLANGDASGVTVAENIQLVVYGNDLMNGEYNYTVQFVRDAENNPLRPDITVGENGEIGITFVTTVRTNTASYVINYQEETNA